MKDKKRPETDEARQDKDQFFIKIKEFIEANYEPANLDDPLSWICMTTKEIFYQLQLFFPSDSYTLEDVALWLNQTGFQFIEMGRLKFEWTFSKKLPPDLYETDGVQIIQ